MKVFNFLTKTFFIALSFLVTIGFGIESRAEAQKIDLSKSEAGVLDEMASRIKTRELSLDRDSLKIGGVLDVAFGDSALYILDPFGSLVKMPYEKDAVASQANIRDIWPDDVIHPVSLEVNNDSVYVLDMGCASLLVFDKNFQPVKKIQLRYTTCDFTLEGDVIVANSLELPSDPSPFIIYDMDGNVINKLTKDIKYDHINPDILCDKPFLKVDGKLFALDGYSNKVYSLDGNRLIPELEFDFGEKSKPETADTDLSKYVVSTECFHLGDKTVLSYLFDNKRLYCFSEGTKGKPKNGSIFQTSDGYWFFPRWQHNGELVGYAPSEDGKGNGSLLFFSIATEQTIN